MAPVTRKQKRDAQNQIVKLPPPASGPPKPTRGRRPLPPPEPSPLTPKPMMVHYEYSDWNRFMNAPFPEDNSDIPLLDLGETEEPLSLWEQADNAWKEHCKKKAKERKARMKRQGGITKRQRKWSRNQKAKKEAEIMEWFEEKLRERERA